MSLKKHYVANSTNTTIPSEYKITPKSIVRKSIKMSKQTHFSVTGRYDRCYNGRYVLFAYVEFEDSVGATLAVALDLKLR